MDLQVKSEAQDIGQGSSSDSRVLMIGSDGQFAKGLKDELASLRCSVDHAAGSADALRQLRATPYSVVITDPDHCIREDLALVHEIREIRPSARVILLAPDGTPEDIIAALREQVFLCKCAPLDAREIARYAVSAIEAGDCAVGIEVISANRNWISVRMNCGAVNAERLIAFFNQLQVTLPERPREELMVAFREILNNAIEHGAQNDPSKSIQVSAIRTARSMVFYVIDPGKGFKRDAIPHAAVSNTPDQPTRHIEIREQSGMRPGGYGILAASGIVDELIYNEVGNEVLLIKYIANSEPLSS
jgi:anti-sigma regulatory factor (Ser/Thr protein kinase)/ActR/RegA family two-component response regulator